MLKKTAVKFLLLPRNAQETVLQGVVRSSFINLIARTIGYFRNVAVAVFFGFSYQTDGFFMAMSLLGIFLIFVDVFDSMGVPQLVKARMQSEEKFKKLAGLLFTFTLVAGLLLSVLATVLIDLILKIPAGFSPQAIEATKLSYVLLIPSLFFSFIFHHFGAILRSQRRFTQYFLGELIISVANFVSVVLGYYLVKDFKVLSISVSVAHMAGALYMLYAGRGFIHIKFYVDETSKRVMLHFLQLSILYAVFHLYILVDRIFASYLGEKAVSALAYGLLIVSIPRGILKFENIAITSLAEQGGSREKLDFYIKKLTLLTLPFVIFFSAIPWLPVKLLFGYGSFSKVDVSLTAEALRFYAPSLPFMFLWPLIYRVFQIKEKLIGIGITAFLGVLLNSLLNYLFVFRLNMGIAGICLGTLGAYFMLCFAGYMMLKKQEVNAMSKSSP